MKPVSNGAYLSKTKLTLGRVTDSGSVCSSRFSFEIDRRKSLFLMKLNLLLDTLIGITVFFIGFSWVEEKFKCIRWIFTLAAGTGGTY